jgi:N-acetylmuramic acid 6-phosphate etherase
VEGAEDDLAAGARAARSLRPRDLLVGISASSVTPYVRGALREARRRRARSVLVTCAPGPGLARLADVVVVIATGPEVLSGSTRLKAGSATKAALNAITTAALVSLGKAYGPLMVDVRPTNAKLRARARRIVAEAAGVPAAAAARALAASRDEVKTAIVVARLRVSPREARRRLRAAGGRLRPALAAGRVAAARPRR